MKILYIHQYFKTPIEGGAIRSYYIAKGMCEAGHEIMMITTHNKKRYEEKNIEGITVHYLPVKYYNHFGFFRRLYSYLLFANKAYFLSNKLNNPDLAYITSTPLTVGLTALMLKKKYKIPYIFEVRDLWPEAPIQIGAIRSGLFKYITRKLEKEVYRNASKIVTLSPGIYDLILQSNQDKPLHFCPNLSDCQFFEITETKNRALMEKHNIGNAFVISYFGAIGNANSLEFYLSAAKSAEKADLNIKFLLIGEGAKLNSLKILAKKLHLENVIFIPHMNKYDLKTYLSITDAAYISFADYPVMELNSPNKFFDAIASGKLVITNTTGWIKDLIEQNKCGFYLNPAHPDHISSLIRPFLEDSQLKLYQRNARNLAETTFEKDMLISKLLDFVTD